MTQSNIISSGSEASDNEESHSGNAENNKTTRVTRSRGGGARSSNSEGRSSRTRRSSASKKHTKHYVEHNYHNHLHDAPESMATRHDDHHTGEEDENSKRRRGGHRGGVAVPFPEKLHYMLSQMEQNETAHIVNWQPHGRSFVVHKPKEFVEDIMPRFFRQTKMTSFQRQLNLYGFARLTAGPDRGGYYHELFLRGRMDLCTLMARTRVKGNGSKAASSPSTEPNFYSMEPCYEQDVLSKDDAMIPDSILQARLLCDTTEQHTPPSLTLNPGNDMMISMQDDVLSAYPIVEDHEEEDGMILFVEDLDEAEIVLKPFQEVAATDDGASWNSSPPQQSLALVPPATPTGSSTKSLPALVSPIETPKSLISPLPRSMMGDGLFAPLVHAFPALLPRKNNDLPSADDDSRDSTSLDDPCTLHSGDQVYFEGLPFHYLETKDVEMEDTLRPLVVAV